MAGVAGPMLRRSTPDGVRFLAGLFIGAINAGLFLALLTYLIGVGIGGLLSLQSRLFFLAVVCLSLGVADLLNRTPHIWRQVPQSLIHRLTPGLRGLTWGFDIGLLVTTQKVTSLVWAAIAAVTLLSPLWAPAMLLGIAVLSSLSVVFTSFANRTFDVGRGRDRMWLRWIRVASGALLVAVAVATFLQAAKV